uniref:IRF-2BP1/2-like middle domain-containing protein n=1 Tax=Amphimedon queenslandica TaxID=400682 RepID=A0A1X7SZW3_AMPQE
MIRLRNNPQWRAALAAGVAVSQQSGRQIFPSHPVQFPFQLFPPQLLSQNPQLQASLMMMAQNNLASKQPEAPLKIRHHHKADEQKIIHHKADEQKIINQNADYDELRNLPALEDIIQMLVALNRSTPFRIRFRQDMTVFGRVIGFYTRSSILKVMIEYPIYSGEVLSCATQAASKMLMDFRVKHGEGSLKPSTKGTASGYQDIQYERIYSHPDEWRRLGDLINEEVRMFKTGSLNQGLLPQPHLFQEDRSPEYLKSQYLKKFCADKEVVEAVEKALKGTVATDTTDHSHENKSPPIVLISSEQGQ